MVITDPKSVTERIKVAKDFAAQFKFSLPIWVDSIEDPFEKTFAAWPDRIYLLDAEGKVAYKSGPGPKGFIVSQAPPAIEKLLASAGGDKLDIPTAAKVKAEEILKEAGLGPDDLSAVWKHVAKRRDAYAAVDKALNALLSSTPEAAPQLMQAFQAAIDAYGKQLEPLDGELNAVIKYHEKPMVFTRLLGLGIIGGVPGSPLAGLKALVPAKPTSPP